MINPRPKDVLENLIATLDEKVLPRLKEADLLSAVTSTKFLIRYVLNQLENEPASFAAELPKITQLLGQAKGFLIEVQATDTIARVEAALADDTAPANHEALAQRVQDLREGLHAALGHLIENRDAYQSNPGYTPLRDAIRDYLAWQNIEEARIIAPTYYGQGARR